MRQEVLTTPSNRILIRGQSTLPAQSQPSAGSQSPPGTVPPLPQAHFWYIRAGWWPQPSLPSQNYTQGGEEADDSVGVG